MGCLYSHKKKVDLHELFADYLNRDIILIIINYYTSQTYEEFNHYYHSIYRYKSIILQRNQYIVKPCCKESCCFENPTMYNILNNSKNIQFYNCGLRIDGCLVHGEPGIVAVVDFSYDNTYHFRLYVTHLSLQSHAYIIIY